MRAHEVIQTIRKQPFEPLEFEFSGGHKEVVRRPDNIIVTGDTVIIAQYGESEQVPEWVKHYSIGHLISIEPANARSN